MIELELSIASIQEALLRERYIGSEEIAITLFASLKLGRPLLVEGAAGVGKTEIAKVLSKALNRPLVRLQCHEGIDEAKSLYEWNYQKQLLAIQGGKEDGPSLFSDTYLLERPLLKSIRSAEPVVLLIDEIDKSDEEFEAFLLEILSEMQVTIPELGTITATTRPFVVLTSNDTRPLSEALKRRCAYLYLQYPDPEKEVSIILAKMPQADVELAGQVSRAVAYLRQSERIVKKPSIAETLDWMGALEALGHPRLTPENARQTLGFALKTKDDMDEILGDDDFDQCLS